MYETKAQADKRRRDHISKHARNALIDRLARYKAKAYDWRDLARKAAAAKYRRPVPGPNGLFGPRKNRQWLENGLAAFRWEFADKVEGLTLRHTGYYDSEFCEEVYRGVVLKTNRGTFISGAVHGSESRKSGWQSACGNDSAVIIDSGYFHDSEVDAARGADGLAERMAEEEREYQTHANAGIQAAELQAEIAETRADTLASLAELRQARKALARDSAAFPHLCEQLRRDMRAAVRGITSKRKKIAELVRSHGSESAFRDHFPA